MILTLCFLFVAVVLWLRYRIHTKGLEEVVQKGRKGILFLPNHPGLIDPVILSRILFCKFHPRAVVDEKQIRNTVLKYLHKRLRILPLPDMGIVGRKGAEMVMHQIDACVDALRAGDNLLLYPAGRIYRSRLEKLRGNGGVAHILSKYPDVRIVLVRTRGVWGSTFSRARGYQEGFMKVCSEHIKHLLLNGLFFVPRRDIQVEFVECPADFPRQGTKDEINRWLENFYNTDAPYNTYVPFYWWEQGGTRVIPEPDDINATIDTKNIPAEVRETVFKKLHELTDKKLILDSHTLGTDLGLDSLVVAELQNWIQEEFGVSVGSPDCLRTVGSMLLAAVGQSAQVEPMKPIPPNWFMRKDPTLLSVPDGCKTVTETFLALAKAKPRFALLGDQTAGVITNRKAVLAVMVLSGEIAKIPAERVGIIMPACAAAFLVYMATLFAGKTPVLINWTVGPLNMNHCLKNSECEHILTSKVVIERLAGRGADFSEVEQMFHYLEDIKGKIGILRKLWCVLMSRISWHSLRKAKVSPYAAILFTSGSENRPKTVPLTHDNVISDVRYAMDAMGLRKDDCMIGMLPPFHSFGLLLNFLMPAIANLRVAYHANPMEGAMLARIIAAYKVTMIVGTPTFAAGILRNGTNEQLASVRMLITGAEKCPEPIYKLFWERCPGAYFLEGYGITECSPVVALNRPAHPRPGTMGPVIDCLKMLIADENLKPVPVGTTGMLYLRGPSIFGGYLNYDGPSPFVEIDGEQWYRTGDLVKADAEGMITFMGRLKRFVKIGGEMISLPAIEDTLTQIYRTEENPHPLAVESLGTDDAPDVTLFTTIPLERETVNQQLRDAGFAPIYSIRHVIQLDEIPLLGSGKTDYQTLKKHKQG